MDLSLSPADAAFREEVREFLDAELTPELRAAGRACSGIFADRPVGQAWLAKLNARGWAAPDWPAEHGGCGWSVTQRYIFQRELALADAPPVAPNGLRMVGPVLIAYGTPEQKARYLPAIRSGDDWWAQGYSEPGAGSDLASLQCRAVRDGDHYVINGTKIWTTHAHWANRMFCLVRTDPDAKKQRGISFLVFDIDLPGISIRPIISISGDHELNQVFFDDVRVPAEALVGEENDGWTVAKYLLSHERSSQYAPSLRARVDRLRRHAKDTGLLAEPDFRAKLAEACVRLDALEATELALVSGLSAGRPPTLAQAAQMKVQGTELRQRLTELAVESLGPAALPWQPAPAGGYPRNDIIGPDYAPVAMGQYLNDRAASIYAGSNEVQRNIMAGVVLGAA